MAALAPMPSARVRMTIAARPLVRLREWNATRRSRRKDMAQASPIRNENSIIGAIAKQHIARYLVRSASGRMLGFRMQCREFGQLRVGLQLVQLAGLHFNDERRPPKSTSGSRDFGSRRYSEFVPRRAGQGCRPTFC